MISRLISHIMDVYLTPAIDTDFMIGPLQNFGLFTDQSFADPDDGEFVATVISKVSNLASLIF